MFLINLKIALRNLRKNRLYALINIAGLAIGLTIYLFGNLIVEYESTQDTFFAKSDRIYTLGLVRAAIENSTTTRSINAVQAALKPAVEANLPDIEASARTINELHAASNSERSFYTNITFADPELLTIFDFTYIEGEAGALDEPRGMVLTETTAIRYFGRTDVLGEIISLNNEHEFVVTAVISIPLKSHFNSTNATNLELLVPIERFSSISRFGSELDTNWGMVNADNFTYVLLPPSLDQEWLQSQLDPLFDQIVPDPQREQILRFTTDPLHRANLTRWENFEVPFLSEIIKLLCLLLLAIACLNYSNLAVAQFMGRSREVGMRKTVGASQTQLLSQFLFESLLVASLALFVAIALLELIIPLFNNFASKALQLDYLANLIWLVSTALVVGLLSGIYPAWIVTSTNAAEALRDAAHKGKQGTLVRSILVGLQFSVSAFLLAVVAVISVQNKSVEAASYIFPRSEIYTLQRLENVIDRLDTLRQELELIPGVESVAFSSQVPYEQISMRSMVTAVQGDQAGRIPINRSVITPEFFATYDIPILAGRYLDRDRADDQSRRGQNAPGTNNVVVNEMALSMLGFGSPEEAINKRIFGLNARDTVIVGVVPTQNILGLMGSTAPWVFIWEAAPPLFAFPPTASIRIGGENFQQVLEDIDSVWNEIIPDYPIEGQFLDEIFNQNFSDMKMMSTVIGGLTLIAMLLAMMGLFGLASFYSAQRIKEIGVRKALGASSKQITRLLIWQFSKPMLWALVLALPAAFFASNLYLNIFADRIDSSLWILVLAGIASVLLGWLTVGGQAYSVARRNPITALRYE